MPFEESWNLLNKLMKKLIKITWEMITIFSKFDLDVFISNNIPLNRLLAVMSFWLLYT